eukprot:95466-Hanusia_phi.AAC.10
MFCLLSLLTCTCIFLYGIPCGLAECAIPYEETAGILAVTCGVCVGGDGLVPGDYSGSSSGNCICGVTKNYKGSCTYGELTTVGNCCVYKGWYSIGKDSDGFPALDICDLECPPNKYKVDECRMGHNIVCRDCATCGGIQGNVWHVGNALKVTTRIGGVLGRTMPFVLNVNHVVPIISRLKHAALPTQHCVSRAIHQISRVQRGNTGQAAVGHQTMGHVLLVQNALEGNSLRLNAAGQRTGVARIVRFVGNWNNACPQGEFRWGCGNGFRGHCRPCTPCLRGEYPEKACGVSNDNSCIPCKSCASAEYLVGGCNQTHNFQCNSCNSFPSTCATNSYRVMCGYGKIGTCLECDTCADGYYERFSCNGVNNTFCLPCKSCPSVEEGFFTKTSCGRFNDATCMACTICPSNFAETSPCTDYADRVCKPCEGNCQPSGFRTLSQDCVLGLGFCTDCTVCSEFEYAISNCSEFADTVCGSCTELELSCRGTLIGCGGYSPGYCEPLLSKDSSLSLFVLVSFTDYDLPPQRLGAIKTCLLQAFGVTKSSVVLAPQIASLATGNHIVGTGTGITSTSFLVYLTVVERIVVQNRMRIAPKSFEREIEEDIKQRLGDRLADIDIITFGEFLEPSCVCQVYGAKENVLKRHGVEHEKVDLSRDDRDAGLQGMSAGFPR